MSSIFGSKSKQTGYQSSSSLSENQAYPIIKDIYTKPAGWGQAGAQAVSDLLTGGGERLSAFKDATGLGAENNQSLNLVTSLLSGDASGFNSFKKNAGFGSELSEGLKGITGSAAAAGTLRSGSTGKSYANYATNLNNSFLDRYLSGNLNAANAYNTAQSTPLQNYLLGNQSLSDTGIRSGQILAQAGNTALAQSTGTNNSSSKSGLGGLF